MLEIEMLPAAAAEDAVLVAEVSDLVNRAYRVAEQGLWQDGIARTTPTETANAVVLGQLAVAREQGRLVGCIRTRQIDDETGWFGALAVDHAHSGRGIGGELVGYAERRAMSSSASTMQLELLVPVVAHAHTDLLATWYQRLGYGRSSDAIWRTSNPPPFRFSRCRLRSSSCRSDSPHPSGNCPQSGPATREGA